MKNATVTEYFKVILQMNDLFWKINNILIAS